MSEQQEPIEAPTTGAAALSSDVPFKDRDFGSAQLQQIFSCGKTHLWMVILPQLEELGGVNHEGSRVKVTGAAILALRARKLAEAPQRSALGSRGSEQLRKSRIGKRRSRQSGSAS
jgi:hypothetical protein